MNTQLSYSNSSWLPIEDNRLIIAVNRFGIRNRSWNNISREVATRSPRECRNRWSWIIYSAFMLLQINHNLSSTHRPRMIRRLRAVNYRQTPRFRNAIRNAASNTPTHRDIRMTLDYILN
ncbi:unnamed protein product [Rhizophagus irregularis]|uniref:Uncharacterized protein n=1 Tax=Rhizophagus irregularis TaxID=588596 RepID=A0A2N1NW96_9GLOM|nr:hypothetical protein RhiirC2_770504 [Rhizophagus irregularis]CAB4401801.1 unnamed protein product [Rhizophagus irregularis]CAB5395124.1 unnamed protein product [Rhizophagus irregularis]